MRELHFTHSAVRDLLRLRAFIAQHDPAAAMRVSLRLRTSLQNLVVHPALGLPVEGLPSVRELVICDYIARYRVSERELMVLRIWHGKEDR